MLRSLHGCLVTLFEHVPSRNGEEIVPPSGRWCYVSQNSCHRACSSRFRDRNHLGCHLPFQSHRSRHSALLERLAVCFHLHDIRWLLFLRCLQNYSGSESVVRFSINAPTSLPLGANHWPDTCPVCEASDPVFFHIDFDWFSRYWIIFALLWNHGVRCACSVLFRDPIRLSWHNHLLVSHTFPSKHQGNRLRVAIPHAAAAESDCRRISRGAFRGCR
jgi:hypothetical protein